MRVNITFCINSRHVLNKVFDHKPTLHEACYLLTEEDKSLFPNADIYFYHNGEEIKLEDKLVNGMTIVVSINNLTKERELIKDMERFGSIHDGCYSKTSNRELPDDDSFIIPSDFIDLSDDLSHLSESSAKFIRKIREVPY